MSHPIGDEPTAVVSGATSGIGKAICLKLVELDYKVTAIGRDQSALEELRDTLQNINAVELDLRDRAALKAVISHLQIDVLVNNAGIITPGVEFQNMEQSDIDSIFDINLCAAVFVTRLALSGMISRSRGHIFFTGSIAGHSAFPKMTVYGASKAAISSFAAALRCDLSGTGIRVTEIVAGRVETRLYRDVFSEEERNDLYRRFTPVQPKDVARTVSHALTMPEHVDITRLDILPTDQYVGGGGYAKKDQQ